MSMSDAEDDGVAAAAVPPIYVTEPVKAPTLNGIGRSDVRIFLRAWEKYQSEIQSRQAEALGVKGRRLRDCIRRGLLERLCDFELEDASPLTVDDEVLIQFLQDILGLPVADASAVKKSLESLRMNMSIKDPAERVGRLFEAFNDILKVGGADVRDRMMSSKGVKYLLDAVRPLELRRILTDKLAVTDNDGRRSVKAFYRLLKQQAVTVEVLLNAQKAVRGGGGGGNTRDVGGASGKQTTGQQRSVSRSPARTSPAKVAASAPRTPQRQASRQPARGGFGCFNCGEAHYVRNCPTASAQQKQLMSTPSRHTRGSWQRRQGQGGEKPRAAPAAGAGGKARSVKEVSAGDGDDSGKQEEAVRASVRSIKSVTSGDAPDGDATLGSDLLTVPYILDSGADRTCVTTAVKSDMLKQDPDIMVERLDKPVLLERAGGEILKVTEVIKMNVKLGTKEGPAFLRDVKCWVLPGDVKELLVGKTEFKRLGIKGPAAELRAKLAAARRIHEEELRDPTEAVGEQQTSSEEDVATDSEEDTFLPEDIRPLPARDVSSADVEGMAPEIDATATEELEEALQEMLNRARAKGASLHFLLKVKQLVNKYKNLWRTKLGYDEPASVPPLTVELLDETKMPVNHPARKYSPLQRKFLKEHVEELVRLGLARVSNSAWSSPVVLVRKKDGTWRMCIDLRGINSRTLPFPWPLPRLDTIMENLRAAVLFAAFDLLRGYWQFPVRARDTKFFAFVTPHGLFELTRVPMGAKNSAPHFQRVMEEVLKPLLYVSLLVYLDDILVYAASEEGLLASLEEMWALLDARGIKLNPRKSKLFCKQIKWCGRLLSADGVGVDPEFAHALLEMEPPVTAGDLMQFVHGAGWLRDYIPDFARCLLPLNDCLNALLKELPRRTKRLAKTKLLSDGCWGREEAKAFANVKQAIADAVTLAYPDPRKEFCLFTDASREGWGALLTQLLGEHLSKPVAEQPHQPLAFLSGIFRGSQLNWSTVDKEAFAVKESCEKLTHVLERERGFRIFTDHLNLKYIFAPTEVVSAVPRTTAERLERWALRLRAFEYVIEHIDGAANVWADLLSRWGGRKALEAHSKAIHLRVQDSRAVPYAGRMGDPPVDEEWPVMEHIVAAQRHAVKPRNLGMGEDEVWRDEMGRVWLPRGARKLIARLLVIAHAGASGHRGRKATLTPLRERFVWQGMRGDVTTFLQRCLQCCRCADGGPVPRTLGKQLRAHERCEILHFDFLSMGTDAHSGEQYVLVLKDDYSCHVELVPAHRATAVVAADAICWWASRFKMPAIFISDQGTHFRNQLVDELTRVTKVQHHFTTARCSWANGSVERVNRELIRVMARLLSEDEMVGGDWLELLPVVQSVLNSSVSARLGGHSPVEVMVGLKPTHALDAVVRRDAESTVGARIVQLSPGAVHQHCETLIEALMAWHHEADAARDARQSQNQAAREQVAAAVDWELGDYVLKYVARGGRAGGQKLSVRWQGPYQVVDTLSPNIYVIQDLQRGPRREVHGSKLKKYADANWEVTEEVRRQAAHDSQSFLVEKLKAWRTNPDTGVLELKVGWKGFSTAEDTWEPVEALREDIPAMVSVFLKRHADEDTAVASAV
jgi:transposase InsO family protein